MEEEVVTISKEEYDRLLAKSFWLDCLNAAGIDNTDAYSYAFEVREVWENA